MQQNKSPATCCQSGTIHQLTRRAWALIEGANEGNSRSAELATGYKWGEPKLVPHIEKILARAREEKDERTEELAERFLKKSEK